MRCLKPSVYWKSVEWEKKRPKTFECFNGHTVQSTVTRINAGEVCAKCAADDPEKARVHVESILKKKKLVLIGWNGLTRSAVLECRAGHRLSVTPLAVSRGEKCSACTKLRRMSDGEKAAMDALKGEGVEFEHDKPGLFSQKRLRADFYVPSLNLVIEVDGAQHFKTSKKWRSAGFARDLCKDDECRSRGIHLARIPHIGNPAIIASQVTLALAHVRSGGPLLGATPEYYSAPTVFLPRV